METTNQQIRKVEGATQETETADKRREVHKAVETLVDYRMLENSQAEAIKRDFEEAFGGLA